MDDTNTATVVLSERLPAYQSHKIVRAFKIDEITPSDVKADDTFLISKSLEGRIVVGPEYLAKHNPQVGGYYVKYEAGYESFSPADAFEDGYTLIS